jgi:hypothetical protein
VTEPTRRERTAKLLIAYLDTLAHAAAGIPHAETERLFERATVATMRAVALELLEADRAAAIWRDAHERHPHLPHFELDEAAPQARLAA